ncbi:hypothetical protein [Kribbella antiqua]|uniref:hypothetical protein n=1 Tax=Kribbella antiqua TaxID=2512217 RepID=UPI00104ECF22|nr:hypothetical protein [Kribbella antiqua]
MSTREELTTETFTQLAVARTHLTMAADAAYELEDELAKVDEGIVGLTGLAGQIRSDETRRRDLPNVPEFARGVQVHFGDVRDKIDVIHEHLTQGALTIASARVYVDELEKLPGGKEGPAVAAAQQLRRQLDLFEEAINTATQRLQQTTKRFTNADTHLVPVLQLPVRVDDRSATATLIDDASAAMNLEVAAVSGGVDDLGAGFDEASQSAYHAAKDASALGRAVRAGLNPPDPAGRRTRAAASGEDQRRRADGRTQGSSRDR